MVPFKCSFLTPNFYSSHEMVRRDERGLLKGGLRCNLTESHFSSNLESNQAN